MFYLTITLFVGYVLVNTALKIITDRDPWGNLPEHINSSEEWNGKDDDKHVYTQWIKYVKGYFAYSWKRTHWFGKLRKFPITLFAIFGPGDSRWENDFMFVRSINKPIFFYKPSTQSFYLSRVQYFCDWHLMVQWPLFIGIHFKYGKTGLVNAYIGWKRDTDCFWFPSIYIGTSWK